MSDWPREIGGHIVTRDVHLDPASGDAGAYRCVECGEVFEELDAERIRAKACSQSTLDENAVGLTPDDV